jgi:hypothetical protein
MGPWETGRPLALLLTFLVIPLVSVRDCLAAELPLSHCLYIKSEDGMELVEQ